MLKAYAVITNFNIVLSILLVLSSFVLINAYAATLTVNLDEQNPTDFRAVVTGTAVGGGRDEIALNQGGSAVFNVNPGQYRISMLSDDGIAFAVDVIDPDPACDGTIGSDNDNEQCDVVLGNRFDDGFGVGGGIPLGDENFGAEILSTPESLAKTQTGVQLVRNDERSDPPFRACEAFEVKSDVEGEEDTIFIRSPSSAEYLIKGAISGERLKSIIKENGRSDATFSIVNDLHQIDNYPISNEINSKYVGQIIYYKENGAKKEVLNFRIDNINTECRYITLIQPSQKFSTSQKNQWTPLTEEGKEKFKKHSIPGDRGAFEQIGMPAYNDNQLMSGESVLKFPTRTEPLSVLGLNPPFGPCVAVVETLGFTDDDEDGEPDAGEAEVIERDNAQFAEYVMVGNLEDKVSSANKNGDENILIKITADLNLLASDSAKITGNANPYVKVEIFLNPDEDPAQKIEFHLKELSYNCHGVGFAR